jgi:reactive intermediate/imine deaminase
MNARRIRTRLDPFEPYAISQGIRVGDLIYLSGQAALDRDGRLVGVGDFDAQAEQTFRNIDELLRAAGSSLAQVIKVSIYLTDMSNFGKIVELRKKWFRKPYPADTIVQVGSLALPELMIEIEAIALARGKILEAASPATRRSSVAKRKRTGARAARRRG